MRIKILDDNGGLITVVANVSDPERELLDYQGASWVDFPETDNERIEKLRRRKIQETKAEGLNRIGAVIPALGNETGLDLMIELWPMLDNTQAGPDILQVKALYIYAKQKITQAQSATEAQLNAYDPATDPGWPTGA